jgi:hypothetical protein
MDSREILPSMYKRNLRKEKYVENISNEVRTECTEWDWKEQCDLLSYGRN